VTFRCIVVTRAIKGSIDSFILNIFNLLFGYYCKLGCGGSLGVSTPFVRRVACSNPALVAMYNAVLTLGNSFICMWCFGVKLRHSTHAVSGAPLSSSGLEEALQKIA